MPKNNGDGHVDELDESDEIHEDDLVILVDEDGEEYRFILLALIELDSGDYAVLAPEEQILDKTREDVDLTFCEVVRAEDGSERFNQVEDEETFNAVRKACAEMLGLTGDSGEEG